jgi:hypothetical protein
MLICLDVDIPSILPSLQKSQQGALVNANEMNIFPVENRE